MDYSNGGRKGVEGMKLQWIVVFKREQGVSGEWGDG